MNQQQGKAYWLANRRILWVLLLLWFIVALGAPVLFVDFLNQFSLGGFPLGFWFNQQGSILLFVVIIFIYHLLMNRLERRFNAQAAKDKQA